MAGGLASISSVGRGLESDCCDPVCLSRHCGWELPIATDGFRGRGWMGRIFIITDGQSSLWNRKFSMEGLTHPQLFF